MSVGLFAFVVSIFVFVVAYNLLHDYNFFHKDK